MENQRNYESVFNALQKISQENDIDFGLDGYTAETFKQRYFTGPGNIGVLYDKLNKISDETNLDFGQGSRDEWLASFGYKRSATDGEYETLDGKRVGQASQIKRPAGNAAGTAAGTVAPDTVRPDGNVFTESQLEAVENGAAVAAPIDVPNSPLQPEEYKIPKLFDYEKRKEEYSNAEWGKKQKSMMEAVRPGSNTTFEERAKSIQEAQEADETRKMVRGDYDKQNFDSFYNKHIEPVFGEEKKEAVERAYQEYKNNSDGIHVPDVMGHGAMQNAFAASVASEKYTDPFRVVNKTIHRIQDDQGYTDYILDRMGVNGSVSDKGESPQLTDEESEMFKHLFSNEAEEVASLISDKLYDTYKDADAPQGVLDYISGKALHDNFASSLMNALIRRAADSSGIREQLRQMAYEQYGQSKEGFGGWSMRAAGAAAPFAVDMLTGGFAVPSAVGEAVVKGGVRMAAKEVEKEAVKRAVSSGISREAAEQAIAGVGERYLATNAPILNLALHTVGGAMNFSTYEAQSEAIRQLSEGEFSPENLVKQAAHGAVLGAATGGVGGAIGKLTQSGNIITKVAGDIGSIGAETGIFATSAALQKAYDQGISIVDVDWSEPLGESAGMVIGMKGVGMAMNPGTLVQRYNQSKDYDLKLNKHNLDELKTLGYDLDNIFHGLRDLGNITPMREETLVRGYELKPGTTPSERKQGTLEKEERVDEEAYRNIMDSDVVSSETKRKVHYLATGHIMSEEPVFGATIINNEDGSAQVETLNAKGQRVSLKDFDSQEEAQTYYDSIKDQARANTIGGLERICEEVGVDVVAKAKSRTEEETGATVDDLNFLANLSKEESEKILDTYVKNLHESYMEKFNENLKREERTEGEADGEAGADGTGGNEPPVSPSTERTSEPERPAEKPATEVSGTERRPAGEAAGTAAGEAAGTVRSERRQVAFDRGAEAVKNPASLAGVVYDRTLANTRLNVLLPDSNPILGHLRRDIIKAAEEGNDAEIDRLVEANAGSLNAQQKEAIELWRDAEETSRGVDESVVQEVQSYEQRRREELKEITNDEGNIVELQLRDGHKAYHLSGNMDNRHNGIMVKTDEGETKMVPVEHTTVIGEARPMEEVLRADVDIYGQELEQNLASLAEGTSFIPGNSYDVAIGNYLFTVEYEGNDAVGNMVFKEPDGKQSAFSPQDVQKFVQDATVMKIQAQLKQEKDAAMEMQRNERYSKGIVGYTEGKPDLSNKKTDVRAAAEYLAASVSDGESDGHSEALKGVETEISNLREQRDYSEETVNRLSVKQELQGLSEQEEIALAESQQAIDEAADRRRKWGEIRQALMTDEERHKFEAEKQKDIKKAMDAAAEEPATKVTDTERNTERSTERNTERNVPTGKELLEKYEEQGDAENAVEAMRAELKSQYMNELYPKVSAVRDAFNDYRQGLIDKTPDELKQMATELKVLEAEENAMKKKSVALKNLASSLGRVYADRRKQQLSPHEYKMQQLEKETNKAKKLKLAKEAFKEDDEAMSVLENLEPLDIYEHIADNLGEGSLSWEGFDRGEHHVRGVVDMVGKDKKRGIGKDSDTIGYNSFLAPTGQGKGYDEVVHAIAEGSPYSTEDVANALYDMLTSASKPTDISHRIINERIARAEDIYESNLEREREAEEEAKRENLDNEIMQMTGMTTEEYDAYISDLENRLAEQEGYKTREEYFNQIVEDYEREQGIIGGGQAQGAMGVQGKEGEQGAAEGTGEEGAGAAEIKKPVLPEVEDGVLAPEVGTVIDIDGRPYRVVDKFKWKDGKKGFVVRDAEGNKYHLPLQKEYKIYEGEPVDFRKASALGGFRESRGGDKQVDEFIQEEGHITSFRKNGEDAWDVDKSAERAETIASIADQSETVQEFLDNLSKVGIVNHLMINATPILYFFARYKDGHITRDEFKALFDLSKKAEDVRREKETATNVRDNGNNSVPLQSNTENHGTETGEHNAEQRSERTGLREQLAGGTQGSGDGIDISVLTEGLRPEQSGDNTDRPRHQQEAFGYHVIQKAKDNGLYIEPSSWKDFGKRVGGITGESIVYIDEANNQVVKVKDPFAKAPMKGHSANDAIYEHITHNLLFPNSKYKLIGVSDFNGGVRFLLTQDYLKDGYQPATQEQIDDYLINVLGLEKEDKYYYGNDYYSITDVGAGGDNVLVGPNGELYFIDPIIKFKKPAKEVLKYLGYDRAKEAEERTAEGAAEANEDLSRQGDRNSGGVENGSTEERAKAEPLAEAGAGEESARSEGSGDDGRIGFPARLAEAKSETNTNPTEEQKKAGNYKMGHISFGGYRMSIENPKGSTRSGKDQNGKAWSIEMQDTYGYIGKKYGTDGDHLDFFINDDADLDNWNGRVYVVDQKNEDGSFDEHKVMYGYPTFKAAKQAYERNYEAGWWDKHVQAMTGVTKDTFDKWLNDSDHKRKPFAEYSRTKNADTITDNVDQLLADVRDRAMKNVNELQNVTTSYKDGELEKRTIAELEQLKKKREKDASIARYSMKAFNIEEGSDKEHTLKMNEAKAKADIAAINEVLKRKKEERQAAIEQQEIGFAVTDRLNDMGYDVETDPREVRRMRKQAEKDRSEEGKMRHMQTSDGTVYGFVYRGKMYMDIRKIDGNLPLHEYAHPWCEAFRKMNPEGWKDVVKTMQTDKDTWDFVKQLNPDLKSDDDIAEEMIAKGTGEKGEQYAKAEYERMHGKDAGWKSKWNTIWQNIAKAIQDFWKQVGDYLHIKYETPEQVYDQVIRDFANNVNPKKKMEKWLKERDKSYLEAVKTGDEAKAKELFDAALRENVGSGIVPFVSAGGYRGKMQKLAHGIKSRDPKVIAEVADLMTPIIPKDAVLVPAPSHTGEATDMLDLAKAISERTGAPVADVLKSAERGSQYEAKNAGKPLAASEMGITVQGELPEGKLPVVIDNVVDTGNTAEACVKALGKGIVASLADSKGRFKRVAALTSAEPVVTDKNGKVVPLSKRFKFDSKYLETIVQKQQLEEPETVDEVETTLARIERKSDAYKEMVKRDQDRIFELGFSKKYENHPNRKLFNSGRLFGAASEYLEEAAFQLLGYERFSIAQMFPNGRSNPWGDIFGILQYAIEKKGLNPEYLKKVNNRDWNAPDDEYGMKPTIMSDDDWSAYTKSIMSGEKHLFTSDELREIAALLPQNLKEDLFHDLINLSRIKTIEDMKNHLLVMNDGDNAQQLIKAVRAQINDARENGAKKITNAMVTDFVKNALNKTEVLPKGDNELPQFMVEGNLFSDEDFEEPEPAETVAMPIMNAYGLNENSPIGKKLTELKEQAGKNALVGYSDNGMYVFPGEDGLTMTDIVNIKSKQFVTVDGMECVAIPEKDLSIVSAKLVAEGYKLAITDKDAPAEEPATPAGEAAGTEAAGTVGTEPQDAVDEMLNEVDRRKEAAKVRAEKEADKNEAEKTIDNYLKEQKGDSDETKIKKRATKAVLKLLKDNKVPYRLADEKEEKSMLKLFSMFNKEAVKNFARKVSIRSKAPHGHGRYAVYNMEDPFGVPMYAEKLSVAKEIQDYMNRTKGSSWEILDIGYADEAVEKPEELKEAANFQAMMGWHGSGTKFDAFDHSHMGEGEGAQAYGWGTYVTEVKGIGKRYAEAMGSRRTPPTYKGMAEPALVHLSKDFWHTIGAETTDQMAMLFDIMRALRWSSDPETMIRRKRELLEHNIKDRQRYIDKISDDIEKGQIIGEALDYAEKLIRRGNVYIKKRQEELDFVNTLDPKDFKGPWNDEKGRFLYKVDIPEDTGNNYFDWTEHLTEKKADEILSDLREYILADKKYGWNGSEIRLDKELEAMKKFFGGAFYGRMAVMLGNSVAGARTEGQRLASELLSRHGYVGVKYPAQYRSGGREDGAKNYVIFNEKDAKIVDTIQFMVETPDAEAMNPIGEKEVKNVVVDTTKTPLPNNRKEALEAVSKMQRPFVNKDQNKEITVSNKAVRHTATEDHDRSDVQCIGVIDQIIENAVKIGNEPVKEDESGHTHAVEIYYCPVNIDGKQYSARLTVKQYENGGLVLEQYQLYDLSAKEKSGTSYTVRGSKNLAPVSASDSGYKVKDLIWKSQENDQKLLGISEKDGLSFHAEKNGIMGWSDKTGVTMTKKGLNPNTPIHECNHLWDGWCQEENPDLWKDIVEAMKSTAMWQEIKKNPNYRSIWDDDDKMASEVKSRLSGATSEEEFMKAAFKPGTSESIINKVKSVLKKFWESILRLFGKTTKTVGDEWKSVEAIRRMTLRDLMEGDFDKVLNVLQETDEVAPMDGEINDKSLVGLHNLSVDQLKRALKNGGLANPSVAVIDALKQTHNKYGDVTLVLPKSMVAAKTGKHKGVFGGDIYSPNYPQVYTRISDKNQTKLADWINEQTGDKGYRMGIFRQFMQNVEHGDYSGLEYIFLKEKGVDMSDIDGYVREGVDNFWVDYINKYTNPASFASDWNKDKEMREAITKHIQSSFIQDIMKYYINQEKERRYAAGETPKQVFDARQEIRLEAFKKAKEEVENDKLMQDENGNPDFDIVNEIFQKNFRLYHIRGDFDPSETRWNVGKYIRDHNLYEEYDQWARNLLEQYDPKEQLYNGTDNMGRQKFIANTLENASRLMRQQGLQGGDSFFAASMGGARAQLTPVFKTLAEIRKNKWRLGEEAFENAKEELEGEYSELAMLFDNDSSYFEGKYYDLIDAMKSGDAYKWAHKNGFDISEEDGKRIDAFAEALRNMPTGYFELKFERPVGLNEFAVAVVPDTTPYTVIDELKREGLDVRTYDSTGSEEERDASRREVLMDAVGMRDDILFHIETDEDEIERLEREPKEVGYRNVVMNPDGTLGSPMANRLGKKGAGRQATSMFEFGKWERSDENPQLADENGKINLIKPNGKPVEGVDYNPYIHIRPNKINKQFKEAWRRPELIYVETEYPKSELEGGYQAEKAAKSVGRHPWGSNGEELILSRWDKPVRMVPWEEVADDWEKEFAGRGVEFDIIPPALLPILAERGVEILPPHKGMGKACEEAYERFLAGKPQGTVKKQKVSGEAEAPNEYDVAVRDKLIDDYLKPAGIGFYSDAEAEKILEEGKGGVKLSKEIGEKEVKNVIVDTSMTPLPNNRQEAIDAVSKLARPFINRDQAKEIKVFNQAVKHTAMQDHDRSDVRCLGVIDKIIKFAVKIGNESPAEDEKGHTNEVEIYYCPVNIDGIQYSARLVVKRYENRGLVLDDYQLYDLSAKENKTDAVTRATGQNALTSPSASVSGYKVKEIIHISQENDQKLLGITDKNGLQFFKTSDGEVYGFALNGKIGIDRRTAKADTPIHEYGHLWAAALRKVNPEEWKNVVKLMKGVKDIWDAVKRDYSELKTEDDIAEEVLTQYSGSRGRQRFYEERERVLNDQSISGDEKVRLFTIFENVKRALHAFWGRVADFLHIHYTSSEQVADQVLGDLLSGINPEREAKKYASETGRIKAKAEQDGSFMKAPDGSRSKLSEKGWLAARTEGFKKWIGGDWEALSGKTAEHTVDESLRNKLDRNGEPQEKYVQGYLERPRKPGKPKKKDSETMAEYFNRLTLYNEAIKYWPETEEQWKAVVYRHDGSALPDETAIHEKWMQKYEDDLAKWKEDNALAPDAEAPVEKPVAGDADPLDFTKTMADWRHNEALWKTAPDKSDYEREAEAEVYSMLAALELKHHPMSYSARMRQMGASLKQVREAVLTQKRYDQATVQSVVDFAKNFMSLGFGDNIGRGDLEGILTSVKRAVGARSIRDSVDSIMEKLVENHLRNLSNFLEKLTNVKDKRLNPTGVEVQGELDLEGQRSIAEFRRLRSTRMTPEEITSRMNELADKIMNDPENRSQWEAEYDGAHAALTYAEGVAANKKACADAEDAIKDAVKGYSHSGRSYAAQQELLASLHKGMNDLLFERIDLYGQLFDELGGILGESRERAKEFREREKARVFNIHRLAAIDMAGRDANETHPQGWKQALNNSAVARLPLSSLGTFEQLMKQFGGRHPNGEGELYNHFMRGFIDATNAEQVGLENAKGMLDAKASEVFGKKMQWSHLYYLERSMPTMDVTWRDSEGNQHTYTLSQGNMLAIYMWNKMHDGQMKLRKMDIDDNDVMRITEHIDPKLIELADWVQQEFLPTLRTKYNKVHEQEFGASMAEIDNYFPLRIIKDSIQKNDDLTADPNMDSVLPSTTTGSIIKRTVNAKPLDILNTDALSLIIEHIEEMEKWAAFTHWNKDVNTLLSYNRFKNQVKNMDTIYGSGDELWDAFRSACQLAAGSYRPKHGKADKAMTVIASGVTGAKIAFRPYTALKQLLSAPAFLYDADPSKFAAYFCNPKNFFYDNFVWAMENLPVLRKRWHSRDMGDTRLTDKTGFGYWHTQTKKWVAQYGMWANGMIDALTCSAGARAVYETRLSNYKKLGLDEAKAKEKALQDAALAYNMTQQSSEGAFVTPIQKDRTLFANTWTLFRNSSMSYTRQSVDAIRNLKRMYSNRQDMLYSLERTFREEEGLSEEQAKVAARAEFKRALWKNMAKLAVCAFILPWFWELGSKVPYLIFGDDDELKKRMLGDVTRKELVIGPMEGLVFGNALNTLWGVASNHEVMDSLSKTTVWKAVSDADVQPLPLFGDMGTMLEKLGYDQAAAIQDMVNIACQMATGVNPQTLTDPIMAAIDASRGDLAKAKEIELFLMRVMMVPTESAQNIYLDELGMDAKKAQSMTYDELAERYAKYKFGKSAPMFGWVYSDEAESKRMESYMKRFDKAAQDRIHIKDDESLRQQFERSESQKERKLIGKEVAGREGSEDYYVKNPGSTEVSKQRRSYYLMNRSWQDILEDIELERINREAKANNDSDKLRAVKAARKRIDAAINSLSVDKDAWNDLREARKEAIQSLK